MQGYSPIDNHNIYSRDNLVRITATRSHHCGRGVFLIAGCAVSVWCGDCAVDIGSGAVPDLLVGFSCLLFGSVVSLFGDLCFF